jgi:hypothetical protein
MPGGGGAGGNWLADDWASAFDATATPRTTSKTTGFMMTASCGEWSIAAQNRMACEAAICLIQRHGWTTRALRTMP